MIVLIKSAPDTDEGERAVKLAKDMAADIVLLENGVYFARKGKLGGFCGTVYALEEDLRIRGLKDDELEKGIKRLNHNDLADLMAEEDKVVDRIQEE
ncbi:MAG: DsrH/TusB family sulfur metabolism protein [Thermodesulfovibrionales bacterium]|nr:DsrH/TusB family sulfur metabolism protein [Thermodesulfovibrionales bacterium]